MSYEFRPRKRLKSDLRKAGSKQLEKAIAESKDSDVDEAVHQVRKRCKKLRGLVRLVRGAEGHYQRDNTWFRDTARLLDELRDSAAMLETFDDLTERFEEQVGPDAFAEVRKALEKRYGETVRSGRDPDEALREARDRLVEAQTWVCKWKVDDDFQVSLRPGLEKTYGRARRAMGDAYDEATSEAFHEWRKRVKYHRYHMRLLRCAWPEMMKMREDALDELGDLLGEDHDLAVLAETLEADEDEALVESRALQVFLGLVARRRGELQTRARLLGQRLFAEEPEALGRRMQAAFEASRRLQGLEPKVADSVVDVGPPADA